MAASEYYEHTTYPAQGAAGSSAAARAEFEAVETGFGKLPDIAGNGNKAVVVNAGGTALTVAAGAPLLSSDIGTTVQAYDADLTTLGAGGTSARSFLGLAIGTDVQAYDADLTTWAGVTPGTGVATALAINVGTAGAPVVNGGALGTPSGGTLTNATGLPAAGVTGTALVAADIGTTVQAYDADLTTWAGVTPGANVGTALAVAVGSAGAFVTFNGAGGTPSSLTGTNITGTAAGLTAGNVTTNANLTGHVTSTGNAAVLGSFTHAQLNTAVSDANVAAAGANGDITSLTALASINGGQIGGLRNRIINGGLLVVQRGAVALSATANTTFFADRWTVQADGGSGLGGNGATTANPGYVSGVFGGALGANWTTATMRFQTRLEAKDTIGLSQTTTSITVSGKVLHMVGSTRTMQIVLSKPTTTADTFSALTTLYTSSTFTVADSTITSFSKTFTLSPADAALGLHVSIEDTATSTASAKNFGVGDLQLEVGSVATPFETRPYGLELALCQRYYYRIAPGASNATLGTAITLSATSVNIATQFPQQMRSTPTALEQDGTATDYDVLFGVTPTTCSAVPSHANANVWFARASFTVASGLTEGKVGICRCATGTTAGYLGWSAEL